VYDQALRQPEYRVRFRFHGQQVPTDLESEVEIQEKPPGEFNIVPKYSPITGRLTGFNVSDPEGHTAAKLARYLEVIGREFVKEVDQTALQNAEVHYTEYRATFVLPQPPEIPQTWWTVGTGKEAFAVNEFFQPPATEVGRFWSIYHSSVPHPDKDFLQMKDDILERAARSGLEVKPARAANIDKYLWALYQVQAPKLIQSGWFYRTFFDGVAHTIGSRFNFSLHFGDLRGFRGVSQAVIHFPVLRNRAFRGFPFGQDASQTATAGPGRSRRPFFVLFIWPGKCCRQL
jgi:hypothetical protein